MAAAALAVPLAVVAATPASAAIAVTDLGTLPANTYSEAVSVRDDGVAVGSSVAPEGGTRAVVFGTGTVTELATPGRNSAAYDINAGGMIVGEAEQAGVERPFPVWWDGDGTLHELPGDYAGLARAVNDAGVIVGHSDNQGLWPLRWESATVPAVRLATLPGGENDSATADVNAEGTVVGFSGAADRIRHAVRWDAAGVIDQLDALPGYPTCFAQAINDAGIIVGSCSGGSGRTAVRWDDTGAVAALPSLGGTDSEAIGVSDAGIVVGVAADADDRYHAVRWGAFGTVTRLATLGGVHGLAYAVNDTGTIVGRTNLPNGQFHATSWRNAG